MNHAIQIQNLKKQYPNFQLGEIDVTIPSGIIVGLIGENGAGKTTLIKSILNIIQLKQGHIELLGKDIQKQEDCIKEDIGVVLDNMFFPELLTPKDIDSVMKGFYQKWDSSLFFDYMTSFELPIRKTIKTMSKGMRKKLEIAVALSHHPKLLILDEPTSGLDPVVRNEILDIFLNFIQDEEHTILLSTHITSDLEHIADRIVFLDQGKIVLDRDRDTIMDQYGILKCSKEELMQIDANDIIRIRNNRYDCEVLVVNRRELQQKYNDFVIDKITLEDLMLLLIKGERQ